MRDEQGSDGLQSALAKASAVAARLRANIPEQSVLAVVQSKEVIGEQLSMFPEEVAAMPQHVARCALFGLPSDRRGIRKMLRDAKLDSRRDSDMLYTGEALGPKEETVWLAALRLGRSRPLGQRLFLNMADLLRELGLSDTGGPRGNRAAVEKRLDRLAKASLTTNWSLSGKRYHVVTGLLKWGYESTSGDMYIQLDAAGADMFKSLAYQPWKVRLSLKSDAAARILSYVCSHQATKPHSVLLDDLRMWCGYAGRLRDFRTSCLASLFELEQRHVLVEGSSGTKPGAHGDVVYWIRDEAVIPADDEELADEVFGSDGCETADASLPLLLQFEGQDGLTDSAESVVKP